MENVRQFPRVSVQLPCSVMADGLVFHSETLDLSLGGVRVALPSLSKIFLTEPVYAVKIDGLPALRVEMRWKGQNAFGAAFTEPRYARPRVQKLLEQLAETPEKVAIAARSPAPAQAGPPFSLPAGSPPR